MTFWPSTLPPDPLFDAITARVLAAAADRTDKEWKGMSDKPSGVAASQAAAADIGYAIQMVEGFEPVKLPPMDEVGRDPDGTPILRNNWGAYNPWIPVGERLPEEGDPVLAAWPQHGNVVGIAWVIKRGKWEDIEGAIGKPSHWMPLPEPPKDE